MTKEKMFCKDTLAIQSARVLPNITNSYGNMFGGALLSRVDNVASISANRFAKSSVMTASLDSMHFLEPIPENTTVRLESFVSGAGTRSMEVFLKVINENLQTDERRLAATAFLTFVTVSKNGEEPATVAEIVPQTEEEIQICKGYEKRRQHRLAEREGNKALASDVTTKYPWE